MITLFLDNQLEIYLAPRRFVTRIVIVRFYLSIIWKIQERGFCFLSHYCSMEKSWQKLFILFKLISEKKRTRPAGLGTVYQPLFLFEKNHLDQSY